MALRTEPIAFHMPNKHSINQATSTAWKVMYLQKQYYQTWWWSPVILVLGRWKDRPQHTLSPKHETKQHTHTHFVEISSGNPWACTISYATEVKRVAEKSVSNCYRERNQIPNSDHLYIWVPPNSAWELMAAWLILKTWGGKSKS